MRSMESYHLLVLVGVLIVSIFSSSVLVMLPAALSNQQSAFGTFPGENGKIAFARSSGGDGYYDAYDIYVMNADGSEETNISNNPADDRFPSWSPDGTKIIFKSDRDGGNSEIYVMNADGTGQTRLTNNPAFDDDPDWGPVPSAPPPPEEDTTPPVLTVPDDIVVEATSGEQGAEVTYTVTAQDNVDGNATLEEDGSTVTQDSVGGNIMISCDPPSGSVFPVGDTEVQCSATDEAGNTGTASFTVTVNPPPPPTPTTPREIIEKLISDIENLDSIPEGTKTRIVAFLERALALLSDDNPRNDASACNIFGAFIERVDADERRDMLTADQAGDLRTQAEDIRDMLGC
jgi:hypothetical protein